MTIILAIAATVVAANAALATFLIARFAREQRVGGAR
jgi:hypothetical protein